MEDRILISACLLGVRCRYDGTGKTNALARLLARKAPCVPVCPEQLGGLPTPRPPAERQGAAVRTRDGSDVTAAYARGAEEALRLARELGCKTAVLKERSPSCGKDCCYDGSFTGTLTNRGGVAAELLEENGIRVIGESELETFLKTL